MRSDEKPKLRRIVYMFVPQGAVLFGFRVTDRAEWPMLDPSRRYSGSRKLYPENKRESAGQVRDFSGRPVVCIDRIEQQVARRQPGVGVDPRNSEGMVDGTTSGACSGRWDKSNPPGRAA